MTIRGSLPAVGAFFLFPLVAATGQNSPTQGQHQAPTYVKQTCPAITVSCPSELGNGKPLTLTASIIGGEPGAVLTYKWTVYGGNIIQGQGTPTIRLKPDGGTSYTGALEVGGLNPSCSSKASCSLVILPPPPITKFGSYGVLPINEEKLRLNNFAAALKNSPGVQGYVLSYGGARGFAGDAKAIGERAKTYLVNERDVNAGRISSVEGGFKEKLTVDLWLVPSGATPPKPEPTLDPSEVRLIKLPLRKTAKRLKTH
jgi:hypothetical protein